MNIALIAPLEKADYLTHSILDGIISLAEKGEIDFRITGGYPNPVSTNRYELNEADFMQYAKAADIILLMNGKIGFNLPLAESVDCFYKTVFVDGGEVGKNNRFDFEIQNRLVGGTYRGWGGVDKELEKRCALYLRREKPYSDTVLPFPFGIPSQVTNNLNLSIEKDIDFVAIFGQDEYPLMRRYAQRRLEKFCSEQGFICRTKSTSGFTQSDVNRTSGREEFYKILARAKVGISIGGGGFDTVRFWELLGSNCLLLTEKIDIYEPDSSRLEYNRIWEFSNLFDFEYQLHKMGKFLRNGYNQRELESEYSKIVADHSTESRVRELIQLSLEAILQKKNTAITI